MTLVRGVNGNVVVPSCVRRIGEGAFSGCAGLAGVVIPPGVVAIGESAFEGCTSLARVRLPRRFEGRLGPNVFAGWELEGVALPEGADPQDPVLVALVVGASDIAATARGGSRATVRVSGLPSGLKFDAKRAARGFDALSGVPAKAGTYTVKVAVGGKTSTFTLKVRALPSWAVGTFTGSFEGYGTDDSYYGTAAFTVSSAGKVSAKLVRQDGKTVSWTHACLDRAEADAEGGTVFRVDAVAGGFRCDLSIRSGIGRGGVVHGVLEGTWSAVVSPEDENLSGEETMLRCYQNLWGRGKALEGLAAKLKGRRLALPTVRDGWGNTHDVTLAFGANGSVTATYRFNGGAAQSASGTLEYRGESTLGIFDEDGDVHYFPGSVIFLNLNLVKGGRAFLEVERFIDEEGEVYQVDERVVGFSEPGARGWTRGRKGGGRAG